ncbi:MAG: hypothetical protein EOM40_04280 [Clostridia bacterium]|nr:hypothetical protein [Clostridia bacterium]
MRWLVFLYLLINTWTDIRRREIHLIYTFVFAVILLGYYLWIGRMPDWMGMCPGICLWALACWKKDRIGHGDGAVVSVMGLALGNAEIWEVVTGGFLLAGAAGILLMILGKGKEYELPFVPFLMISFLLGKAG